MKKRKVGIIGVGSVGSHVAYTLLCKGLCDELVLIDVKEKKVLSDLYDIEDAAAHMDGFCLYHNDYNQLNDADIIVISAGFPPSACKQRLEELDSSVIEVNSIVDSVIKSGFKGIFLVITNPCDVITYHVLNKTGFSKSKVIGTGTMLDSARFKRFMAKELDIDPKFIQGFTMGEHGDSQIIPWSHVYVGNLQVSKYIGKIGKKLDYADILKKTVYAGYDIVSGKGATYFGIATAASTVIKNLFECKKSIMTLSTYLDGEYGISGICMSVPCVIGSNGVENIIELDLTVDELKSLKRSAEILKDTASKIKNN